MKIILKIKSFILLGDTLIHAKSGPETGLMLESAWGFGQIYLLSRR